MGSSSFGPFMSRWVKKSYPDVKSDLCTCFIERGFSLTKDRGYAMITMQSWMFLGSFEKMRSSLIGTSRSCPCFTWAPRVRRHRRRGRQRHGRRRYNGRAACEGAYVRLVDINGSVPSAEGPRGDRRPRLRPVLPPRRRDLQAGPRHPHRLLGQRRVAFSFPRG
ncbi:MAG: Eco57I restriction-modification methylase domain-containing protein [Collinsella sp.]